MKKKKNIFNFILFILIFLIMLRLLGKMFIPKADSDVYYKNEIYKKGYDLDYIGAGCSEMNRGISPMIIWNQTGYTGYNIGSSGERIYTTYYSLKSVLEYTKPKYVFLSTEIIDKKYPLNKYLLRQNWERKPINFASLEMMTNENHKFDIFEYIHSFFPIFAYHQQWKHIEKEPEDYRTKGHYVRAKNYQKKRPTEENFNKYFKKTDKRKKINKLNIKYLLKINELLKSKNIKLVIVGFPNINTYSYSIHNTIKDIAEKNNIEFIDFNEHMDEYKLDYKMDFEDTTHLNGLGAKKLSTFIADYLKSKDELVDKRNDPKFDTWNKDYDVYMKHYNSVVDTIKAEE